MPKFSVEDTLTGKKLELEGDSPPTEAELNQIFSHPLVSSGESNPDLSAGLGTAMTAIGDVQGALLNPAVGMASEMGRRQLEAARQYPGLGNPLYSSFGQMPPQPGTFSQTMLNPAVQLPRLGQQPTGWENVIANVLNPTAQLVGANPAAALRGVANAGIGGLEFVESPVGAATMGLGPIGQRLASLIFAGQMAKATGQQAGELAGGWSKMSPEERGEKLGEVGTSGLFTGLAGRGAAHAKPVGPKGPTPDMPMRKEGKRVVPDIRRQVDEWRDTLRPQDQLRVLKLPPEVQWELVNGPKPGQIMGFDIGLDNLIEQARRRAGGDIPSVPPVAPTPQHAPQQPRKPDQGQADIDALIAKGVLSEEDRTAEVPKKDTLTPEESDEHRVLFKKLNDSLSEQEMHDVIPNLNKLPVTKQLELLREWNKKQEKRAADAANPIPTEQPKLNAPSGPEVIPPSPDVQVREAQARAERQADLDALAGRGAEKPVEPAPDHPSKEELEAELSAEGMNQLPMAEAPRLVSDPSKLRLQPDKQGMYSADQLVNTLKNKLHPAEWEMYDKAGIREVFKSGTKVSQQEAEKWLGENAPRVEVRTFGEESKGKDIRSTSLREVNQLIHELETLGYEVVPDRVSGEDTAISKRGPLETRDWIYNRPEQIAKLPENVREKFVRLWEANKRASEIEAGATGPEDAQYEGDVMTVDRGKTHWSSISPKPESEMKGYVELAAVKPVGRFSKRLGDMSKADLQREQVQFPSTHSFPPNTLAFARGYMEGDTFHVVEVQSDWAQKQRELKEDLEKTPYNPHAREVMEKNLARQQDPLLAHYERLALKAAVEHAIKSGAKRIAVSDAETAMMSEGHDRMASEFVLNNAHNKALADELLEEFDNQTLHENFGLYRDDLKKLQGSVSGFETAYAENWRKAGFHVKQELPPQTKGMELHYDRTLPKILEELTGSKGERVSFGEHKMAFEEKYTGQRRGNVDDTSLVRSPRKDLIFRNPDGTPKTDITALSFPLDKVKSTDFSLFGKDRPPVDLPDKLSQIVNTGDPWTKFDDAVKTLPPEKATEAKVLDFKDGMNAFHLVDRIAEHPEELGRDEAELARFLRDNFEGALRSTELKAGTHPTSPVPAHQVRYEFDDDVAIESSKIWLALDNGVGGASGWTLTQQALHEMAHAATVWALQEPKTPTQIKAVEALTALRKKLVEGMPENVRRFYTQEFLPWLENRGLEDTELFGGGRMQRAYEVGVDPYDWFSRFYALHNNFEFTATFFNDVGYREWLKGAHPLLPARNVFQAVWTRIKEVLGVPSGSAAERMLDTLSALGSEAKEHDGWSFYGKAPKTIMSQVLPAAPPSAATPAVVLHDTAFSERARRIAGKLAGYTMPRHAAISEDLANKGARYGSSRIAAPLVARSMATDVLGKHYKDAAFDRVLGDVIVEDQLRGVKQGFLDAAKKATDPAEAAELTKMAGDVVSLIGRADHALKTEAQFQRLLNNPDIKDSIERHKNIIQPWAETAHKMLGGKAARGGEATDAFANLIAIHGVDDVEGARSMIYGSKKGDITNVLRKGSVFSKQRKGTAADYERSYRAIAERMIRGNYEQVALRNYYRSLIDSGNAYERKPGGSTPPPTAKGVKYVNRTIELRGAGPGMTRRVDLYINPNLVSEFDQVTLKNSRWEKSAGLGLLLDAATDVQIIGLTDAWWHTINMAAAIATSPGSPNIWLDIGRRLPGVNVIDAAVRVGHQFARIVADSPEVQKELAEISRVGAGRGEPYRHGLAARGVEKLVGESTVANPFKWTSAFIKTVDKAGRLALNKMFDNLVDQKLVEDNEFNRREFVNKMGQYNERLMGRLDSTMRELQLSSFVVAGKNFNRLAVQKLLMSPGVKAVNTEAWAKMHVVEALSWLASMVVIPVLANLALTKTWTGRPGTQVGMIDTGKDDEAGRPILIDPLQTMTLRRGVRNIGAQAAFRGIDEKLGLYKTGQEIFKDVLDGYIRPWTGPVVRTASIAITGHEPTASGYLVSKNPDDRFENIKAALFNANPMVSAYLRGREQETGGGKELVATLARATGVMKKGRVPTWERRFEQISGKTPEQSTLSERAGVQKEMNVQRAMHPNLNEQARLEAARRDVFREAAKTDGLKPDLSKANQEFLRVNKLHLTGFHDELSVEKEKLPLTREEQEKLRGYIVKEYNTRISNFASYGMIERWKSDGVLQKQLDARLTQARNRARSLLRADMAKAGRGSP